MRLLERTLKWIDVAPRVHGTDALGGGVERFSERRLSVRASILPDSDGIERHEAGLLRPQTLRLLLPQDAEIALGDGVCIDEKTPSWRCVALYPWSGHIDARLERITGC